MDKKEEACIHTTTKEDMEGGDEGKIVNSPKEEENLAASMDFASLVDSGRLMGPNSRQLFET